MNESFFEIQRFTNVNAILNALKYLKPIKNFAESLALAKLAEYLKGDKPFIKLSKDIGAVADFIGAFYTTVTKKSGLKQADYVKTIAGFVELIDSAVELGMDIAENKKTPKELKVEAGDLLKDTTDFLDDVLDLAVDKSPVWIPMVAATIGLTTSILNTVDGVDEEKLKKLNSSFTKLAGKMAKTSFKAYFPSKKATVADMGPIALATSALGGLLTGIDTALSRVKKYTDNDIPREIAVKDAIIDAIATAIHETSGSYTKGVDDIAFKILRTFMSTITNTKVSDTNKNYAEWIAECFKTLKTGNNGSSSEMIIVDVDNQKVYGDDGNDYIELMTKNSTIWGGNDKDTIVALNNSTSNSILGGVGNDWLLNFGRNNTMYGGAGDDRLVVIGNYGNVLYGDTDGTSGKDAFLIQNAKKANTISGGKGDDVVIFENSSNQVVDYHAGDGKDIVYGWDSSNKLLIDGNYSLRTNEGHVILDVGTGYVALMNAEGKTININGKKISTGDTTSGGNDSLSGGIVTLPGFWNSTKKIVGTAKNDSIRNTLERIAIDALAGNDSISNSGSNVTIKGEAGSDYVDNTGNKVVIDCGNGDDNVRSLGYYTIDSKVNFGKPTHYIWHSLSDIQIDVGNGNDTITNQAHKSSISGGSGNDSIRNTGSNVLIYGDSGNDLIHNTSYQYNSGYGNYITDGGGCVTISGGKGNDTIYGYGDKQLFKYTYGDGNDTILGLESDDTLEISNAKFATFASGQDIILYVGRGNYTLNGSVGLDSSIYLSKPMSNLNIISNMSGQYEVVNLTGSKKMILLLLKMKSSTSYRQNKETILSKLMVQVQK